LEAEVFDGDTPFQGIDIKWSVPIRSLLVDVQQIQDPPSGSHPTLIEVKGFPQLRQRPEEPLDHKDH
jgi:hypothetical protein